MGSTVGQLTHKTEFVKALRRGHRNPWGERWAHCDECKVWNSVHEKPSLTVFEITVFQSI